METVWIIVIVSVLLLLVVGGIILYLYYSQEVPETDLDESEPTDFEDGLLVNVNNNILDYH